MSSRIRHAKFDEDKAIGSMSVNKIYLEDARTLQVFLCHLDEPYRSILILGIAIHEGQFDSETD